LVYSVSLLLPTPGLCEFVNLEYKSKGIVSLYIHSTYLDTHNEIILKSKLYNFIKEGGI